MTINELKKKVSSWSEEERVVTSVSMLEDFINDCDEINEKFGATLDFRDIISMILCVAAAADGDLEGPEYALYTVLCDSIGATAKDIEECEKLLENASGLIDSFEGMAGSLKNVFESTGYSESYENFCIVLAALLIQDGSIEGEELRMLNYFVGDSSASGSISSSSTYQPQDVKVVDYEASFTRDDDRIHFTIGAELKNPNPEHCAKNVNVKVMVKDASGRILETSQNTIDYIDSNATFYYGDEFTIDRGSPANYSIQVNCDEFIQAPENSTFANGITCSHYNVSTNRWGSVEFTGNVHNGYSKKLWTELYFVFYNSAGKITGGANTRATLYGKSEDAFEIHMSTKIARDKVRCSPTFDFMDLID